MDPQKASRLETLARKGDVNWDRLLEMARQHGVTTLLYRNLEVTCPEAVPKEAMDRLRGTFHKNAQRNVFMTGELLKLLKLFETYGIPAVPFKGPSLAASVYGNLALRQFVDLDILVREQDVPKARDQLLSQGYRPEHELTPQEEKVLLRSSHEYPFVHSHKRVMVEVQWKIRPEYFSFPLDHERLWERLEPSSLAGKAVLAFSSEDLLLILCVHGATHLWQTLDLVCDVAELIWAREEMDWELVMEQASALGSERMLYLGLFLASDLLGAPLPNRVTHEVEADPKVKALASEVYERRLFREDNSPPSMSREFPFHPFHLRIRERPGDKIRYIVRLAETTTVRDLTLLRLPGYLYPLYHIIRPVRLTVKHGRRLLKRLL